MYKNKYKKYLKN